MRDRYWRKCVICGDSKDIIKRIPDGSIDFIFTDPPYNIGKHSTGNIPLPGRSPMNNDVADWDLKDFNPEEWADEFIRILKPTGNLFIFTSYNQIGRWYNCLDHRFDTTNFMVWHKTNPAPKIFKAGFLNSCEIIFTCWNKGHTWNFISQSEMHNFFESPICMRPERLSNPKHPTQKPIALLKKIITIATNKGDIIFDPFMGVGSTGVAAVELDRRFIGVEIDQVYFNAAKKRIDNEMGKMESDKDLIVSEPVVSYQQSLFDIGIFKHQEKIVQKDCFKCNATLEPIIKWAGGKEKELKYIIPNMPASFKHYYEPFVGGGSVFMAVQAAEYYINDLSQELISLYKNIAEQNDLFFSYVADIDSAWTNATKFSIENQRLRELYFKFRNDLVSTDELKAAIMQFCGGKKDDIIDMVPKNLRLHIDIFLSEMSKNLFRKMTRMKVLEHEKCELPEKDVSDNIETAIKSAFYMYMRYLYNDGAIMSKNDTLHCVLFYFIRNFCYSGMFRYNDKGEFNVPYGGIAYNSKMLFRKLQYYRSQRLLEHFKNTQISNLDFEQFLRVHNPTEDDFVFLDPPYDSEFSTYAQNEFTQADQVRLANYMINECQAKWMLVIKNTDFIYGLYDKPGVNIRMFDKEYMVSFMNRNNKKVTHLLITNY